MQPVTTAPTPIDGHATDEHDAGDYSLRLLLICHAEAMIPHGDLAIPDAGLTAHGWHQTDVLAGWLKSRYQIDTLISTPELRNRLTAQRIGQTFEAPVTVRRDWSDPHFVSDSGLGGDAQAADDNLEPRRGLRRYCESVTNILDRLRVQHEGDTVAMVMGRRRISATIACLIGNESLQVDADHTSVAELQLRAGQWIICCINRREHIPIPPGEPQLKRNHTPEAATMSYAEDLSREDLSGVVDIYDRAARSDACTDETVLAGKRKRIRSLLTFAKLSAGLTVLDVGAGSGLMALALAERGAAEVVGVDVSPGMLERAEFLRLNSSPEVAARVYYRLADASSLPIADDRFEVVVCRMLLNHTRHPGRILRELVRVLRPKGTLILADLLTNDNPVKRATQNAIEEQRNPTHYAARSAQQYRDLITAAGLMVVSEKVVAFARELDEWLAEVPSDAASDSVVREMIEAGLETDAAGLNARRQRDTLVFDQRLFYLKAVKA